jgi:hypothetical protein
MTWSSETRYWDGRRRKKIPCEKPAEGSTAKLRRMSESGASFGGKRAKFQPGGTSGGIGEFFAGIVMMAVGIYLVFDHVTVHTSYWHFFGSARGSFGATLIPLLGGIGVLSFNGRSILGWLLAVGGIFLILAGVLMNLDVYFQPTSLWTTIVMFGLIACGLGLFIRALRPHRAASSSRDDEGNAA